MHIMIQIVLKPEDLCRFVKEVVGKQDIDCNNYKAILEEVYNYIKQHIVFDIDLKCDCNDMIKFYLVRGVDNSFIIFKLVYYKGINEFSVFVTVSTDYVWKVSDIINTLGKYAKFIDAV
mgnify:CR=1 FL=1